MELNEYGNLKIKPDQLKRFKVAASTRGMKMIDLFDKVLLMLEQQADRPNTDPLGLRGEPQESK